MKTFKKWLAIFMATLFLIMGIRILFGADIDKYIIGTICFGLAYAISKNEGE